MPSLSRDRLANWRGVLQSWTTPLLPDDYAALLNPLWSTRELRGEIVHVQRPESSGSVMITIKPGWGVPISFEAGQYIGIGVQVEGRYVWRSYSLVNAPERRNGLFTICVRAVGDGKLSQHLLLRAEPGQHVRLAAPAGDFYLTDPVPEKLLFITAGSGITPVISMLRALQQHDALGDIVLIHSMRQPEDLVFGELLEQLAKQHPTFRYFLRVTSIDGRVTTEQIEAWAPDFAERAAYVCGPATMLLDIRAWWQEGVEKRYPLRSEQFSLDRASDARGGSIRFGDRAQVRVDGATTILEAAEQSGLQLPFGCRMGICQTCVQTLSEGHAHNLRTGETHEPGSRVRVCCTVANGDIELDV